MTPEDDNLPLPTFEEILICNLCTTSEEVNIIVLHITCFGYIVSFAIHVYRWNCFGIEQSMILDTDESFVSYMLKSFPTRLVTML